MREWKVLKNLSDKAESVTSGGNIYNFAHGEMKIIPAADAKFIIERYLQGPLGEPKFEFVNGKDIPQAFVNKMLADSKNTKILMNKKYDRIQMMYGGIVYVFKTNCKVVLDSELADILQSRSWIQNNKEYALEFVKTEELEKKEEKAPEIVEEKPAEKIEEKKEEVKAEPKEEKHRGRPKKK